MVVNLFSGVIKVDGILRNVFVKLFLFWTSCSGGWKIFLSRAQVALLFGGAKPFVQFQ